MTSFQLTPGVLARRRSRGSASVEAIMVLTMLVLVWTGVQFMGKAYHEALLAKSQARGCAFVTAVSSCQSIPDFCNVSREDEGESAETTAQAKGLSEKSEDGKSSEYTDGPTGEMKSEIKKGLFRRSKTMVTASLPRPKLLGGDSIDLSQKFNLPCNPTPGTLSDLILGFIGNTIGSIF